MPQAESNLTTKESLGVRVLSTERSTSAECDRRMTMSRCAEPQNYVVGCLLSGGRDTSLPVHHNADVLRLIRVNGPVRWTLLRSRVDGGNMQQSLCHIGSEVFTSSTACSFRDTSICAAHQIVSLRTDVGVVPLASYSRPPVVQPPRPFKIHDCEPWNESSTAHLCGVRSSALVVRRSRAL